MKKQILLILLQLSVLLILFSSLSFAEETVCARVKIEIRQELTLERQAFDARMSINNGLDLISLENVDIDVTFSDENGNTVRASFDPNDTSALFFIRLEMVKNKLHYHTPDKIQETIVKKADSRMIYLCETCDHAIGPNYKDAQYFLSMPDLRAV